MNAGAQAKRDGARSSDPSPPSTRARSWALGGALFLALAVVYAPLRDAGFVWDDDGHVTPLALRSWNGLLRIWTEPSATQQYYPLLHSFFWFEARVFGDAAFGYHAVELVLHGTAAILLWKLLIRLEVRGAFVAALVFALHPVQTETVAWISEQKNTLSACFYFAAWHAWLTFDLSRTRGERGALTWVLSLALALAAALSKTVTSTLVPAILLVTWWREGGTTWMRRLPWLLPHFVAAVALGLGTAWLEVHVGGARGAGYELAFAERFVVAGKDLAFYTAKLAWPMHLSFVYPRWATGAPAAWEWAFPLGFVAFLAAFFVARKRLGRGAFVAFALFALTLAPALGFFDAVPFRYSFVADHFQYLACAAPIALVCAWAAAVVVRMPRGASVAARGASAVVVLLLALGARSHARDFVTAEALWRATIERNPRAWMAWENLVDLLNREGRHDEALATSMLAESFDAAHPGLFVNRGIALQQLGRASEALVAFDQALALDARAPKARVNKGSALNALGRQAEALAAFDGALADEPELAAAHMLRGNTLLALQRSDEALLAFGRALELDPDNVQAWFNLGVARGQRKERAGAEAAYRRALSIDPGYLAARFNLGVVLVGEGRVDEGRAELERVARDAAGTDLEAKAQQALQLLAPKR